jgi:hypothetical protein
MDNGISIVGIASVAAERSDHWQALIRTVEVIHHWKRAFLALGRVRPRTALHELGIDTNNHVRQAQAVMALDISAPFGGSMAHAAAAIRAALPVVATRQDREVNPEPAFELVRTAPAEGIRAGWLLRTSGAEL